MELASATGAPGSSSQSAHTASQPSTPFMDGVSPSGRSEIFTDAEDDLTNSPLILAGTQEQRRAAQMEVPEMMLDRAALEVENEDKKEK